MMKPQAPVQSDDSDWSPWGSLESEYIEENEDLEGNQDSDGGSSEEWETDLEPEVVKEGTRQDLTRGQVYLEACQQIGVVPVSAITRDSQNSNIILNHYRVGPLGTKALAIGLQNDHVVTHLELDYNGIHADGVGYLMKMLESNFFIEHLSLRNNSLGHKGASYIARILINNSSIKTLKLSGNNLGNTGAIYIADALLDEIYLRDLDLSYNKICDKGGEQLGQMLVRNESIEELNLSWNHLSNRGAAALSASLKINTTLRQLVLSHNKLGRPDAQCLGQALRANATLKVLDLSNNWIDDQAVALLCSGLTTNDSLRVLKLFDNPITKIGALTLLKTLKDNKSSTMEELDISRVFVCGTFVELLKEVRWSNPTLDIRYSVMTSINRNLSALQVLKDSLKEREETLLDFFKALDTEQTMQVPTAAFRKAVKEAKLPLDARQIEWLIKKFDSKCTASILYSGLDELS